MKKNYFLKNLLLSSVTLMSFQFVPAQNSSQVYWTQTNKNSVHTSQRSWYPNRYETFSLQTSAIISFLGSAPVETSVASRLSAFIIALPMPDGNFNRYTLVESPVMEPGLAAAYPGIKTYSGQGIDDATATIRCDMTQFGFHAYVLSANGTVYIDPLTFGNTENYLVYYKHDLPAGLYHFDCELETDEENADPGNDHERIYQPSSFMAIGNQLRTYRLALAATGEYTAYYGGTVAGALAGIVTSLNRINGVYERELCVHLTLIASDTLVIYTNASTDPYTNSSGSAMLTQNQNTCTSVIGTANFDMGHVFSTGGGGVATRSSICSSTNKARGVTGSNDPIGDPYDIDYVVHEMGHQFGAQHTFNAGSSGACTAGTRSAPAAYEPGSGSTIMAYAGICAPNDLQLHSDAYFHTKSFDEIISYSQTGAGNVCAVITATGNNAPTITIPTTTFNIPYQTPFKLTASSTDPDGDTVTYCWEQYDLGPASNWNTPSGNAPIFRTFNATTSPTRLFPKLANILNNTTAIGEIKPSYARTLHFRCTARDNRSGGGGVVHSASTVSLIVDSTGIPFAITAPNVPGISWAGGSYEQTITWNVGFTDVAPVSTPNVNIYLSTNNGLTFPIVIATNIPNNGSYLFSVPNNPTTTGRIMVEGAGNVFFDINDRVFTITAGSVGVEEIDINNNINVYPNPVNDEVHVVINTPSKGACKILLNDLTGRNVKEISIEKNQPAIDHAIDLSDISKGIYLIRVELPEGVSEKKLVKE